MGKSDKNTHSDDRRENLPLFPAGLVYFRRWHSLRWFLLMLLPIALSAGMFIRAGRVPIGTGIAVFGVVFTAALFVTIASGLNSSNWGTYFRNNEPLRYWLSVSVEFLIYTFFCVAGWL